jgi:L-threonylcarbamoyladenylate synthase
VRGVIVDTSLITRAARLLEAGELVAFPTETVYGLGADADNPAAVAKIYAAKGRPANHPVIVHVAPEVDLAHWAVDVPDFARVLIKAFWPGPLSLVLNKRPGVADACSGGQSTLALRCPDHTVALALLREFKGGQGGLAAPSANRFGRVSPTTARHVRAEFAQELPLVLDGGACRVGIESTIVDCTRGAPIVLRPGQIIEQDILRVLSVSPNDITTKTIAPRVSGDLASHYAPDTPVALLLPAEFARAAPRAGASMGFAEHGAPLHRQMPRDAATYAQMLYATLRELDALHTRSICIECPPDEPAWRGVVDRLTRAASRV